MKKMMLTTVLISLALNSFAKTSIFGEADASALSVNSSSGSALVLSGYASDFGFQGTQAVSDTDEAFFRLAYQADITGEQDWPRLNEGEVGLRGGYGQVSIRFGATPLAKLNGRYHLMDNSPLSNYVLLGGEQANAQSVHVGEKPQDALTYVSPALSGGLSIDAALVPAEVTNGQTGVSVAGHLTQANLRVSAAIELNAEAADTGVMRLNGEVEMGAMTAGGTLQLANNRALESSASHLAGYVKMPLNLASFKSNIQMLAALNSVTDSADATVREMYVGIVQDIALNSKVSLYSLASIQLRDNLNSAVTIFGGGLKVRF